MHDLNNLENLANNNGKDPFRGFEIAAGIYAADRVAGHMRNVEAQNAAMLEQQERLNDQVWIQNQLLSGRTMGSIQRQLDEEAAEQDAANHHAYLARQRLEASQGRVLFYVLFLLADFSIVWAFAGSWVAYVLAVLVTIQMVRGALHRRPVEIIEIEDQPSIPHIGSGSHSAWIEDFRADQTRKLKADPPTG